MDVQLENLAKNKVRLSIKATSSAITVAADLKKMLASQIKVK